ncbi:amidohydrolase [Kordiimonas aestuarii]|uniref:amidohydrolase n=1 Tax=Kordiimonas aestuarii TaxID=1005925 RepID=UPI0021CF762D|nr:amidohydrolase [Kordiimonas aestuarii]
MHKWLLSATAMGCLALTGPLAHAADDADVVLTGGRIYTIDAKGQTASAMAIADGKIVYVGDDEGATAFTGQNTRKYDLAGRPVFPGFTDSHAHLPDGGGTLLGLGLGGMETPEKVLAAIGAYAQAHPEMPVIVGSGWELSLFPEANPSKDLLDEILPDRPVFLSAADGHNGWVNSAMLALAGITAETEDPQNGRIERDAQGVPTGTLREAAMGLVVPYLPEPDLDDVSKNLDAGMGYQLSHGITASIDAAIMDDMLEEAYLKAAERADLPQRVRVSLLAATEMVTSTVTVDNVDDTVANVSARREAYRKRSKGRVDAEAVKIFVDGVAENHTAAMLKPYVGAPMGPHHRGDTNLSEAAMQAYVTKLDQAGFQVHMHAIGDRAVRVALDAVEKSQQANGELGHRHHIAHLEIVQPEDIKRFAKLGVTANMQTLWHFRDAYITDLTEPFLEKDVQRWLYPAQSFEDAGVRVVWGSDWPVSTSDPFDSIEVAVLRRDPHADEGETWNKAEVLSVDEMIRALTIDGAYIMGQDKTRGSLEVGKLADFIILNADPYKVEPQDISEISVLETYMEGKLVYSRTE